jgi:hypothetical protein
MQRPRHKPSRAIRPEPEPEPEPEREGWTGRACGHPRPFTGRDLPHSHHSMQRITPHAAMRRTPCVPYAYHLLSGFLLSR